MPWRRGLPGGVAAAIASWMIAATAVAAGPPGPQVPLNTTTANDQNNVDIAAQPTGFIAVWDSENQLAGAKDGIIARRFDAAGNPLSGEITLNQNTNNSNA